MKKNSFKKKLSVILIACLIFACFPSQIKQLLADTKAIKPIITSPDEEIYWYTLPLQVTFNPVEDAISYKLTVWDALSLTKLINETIQETTYVIDPGKLPMNQFYSVCVRAYFEDQTFSDESYRVPFYLDGGGTPGNTPERPTIKNPMYDDSIDLPMTIQWSFQAKARSYELTIWDNLQTKKLISQNVSKKKFTVSKGSLPGNQDYYVSVRAIYPHGKVSGESERVSFHVNGTSPKSSDKPMKLMADNVNLIFNNSVEVKTTAGQPKGWTKEAWGSNNTVFSYIKSGGHSGTYALKVEIKAYTSGDAKWVFRTIPVVAGQSYRYTDWYQSNISSHIVIHYTKTDGSDDYQELRTAPPSSGWTQFSDTFQVPLNSVSMDIYHLINQVGWLITDDFEIMTYTPTGFPSAMVSITFDDGWEYNVTSALPILKTNQFKATYFFATTFLEKSPATGSASVSGPTAVHLIQSEGHEIGSHSVTHPYLTSLTNDTLTYELSHAKQYLESLAGVGQIVSFATPYGDYNDSVVNAIMGYYKIHRSVDVGYNSMDNLDPYRLKVQNLLSTTTQAEFTSWVEQAIQNKLWLVLVYHKITNTNILEYDSKIADFTAHMALLKNKQNSGLLTVKKINEVIPGATPPPPTTTGTANFTSTPSGASVWIDGSVKGTTPFSASFAPGSYSAKFTLPGYNDASATFSITSGNQTAVNVTLTASTKPSITAPANGAQIQLPYTVKWNGVTGTYYYTVKIWDNQVAYPIIQLSTASLSQTIPLGLLQSQKTYSMTVTATSSTGIVKESDKISFMVGNTTLNQIPIHFQAQVSSRGLLVSM